MATPVAPAAAAKKPEVAQVSTTHQGEGASGVASGVVATQPLDAALKPTTKAVSVAAQSALATSPTTNSGASGARESRSGSTSSLAVGGVEKKRSLAVHPSQDDEPAPLATSSLSVESPSVGGKGKPKSNISTRRSATKKKSLKEDEKRKTRREVSQTWS